ncbi:MAG: ethylbenzene dehydrogenase-related protein [Cyclobacteriaceae bacterium]|nr:ethylbenzene dehydrogenase-related protein [Cyclobacteriaceae bacterium]
MKKQIYYTLALVAIFAMACNNNNEDPPVDPGESSSELLVKKFTTAPTLDGTVDDMWNTAQKLVSSTAVPANLGARNTYYNEDGIGEESLDIFEAYEGEINNFTMRSGYFDNNIYFLIEWDDATDSKDRQSWYFDPDTKLWKGEHKYANATNDKFYEDKFAFLFPIGEVDGFSASTCYAACHSSGGVINSAKDKHTRHYLKNPDQKVDMWHWKRVRSSHNDKIDDQRIKYVEPPNTSSSNGRGGDPDSGNGSRSGYSNNKQTLYNGVTDVSVPKYVVPGGTDYYWIPEADLGSTAKLVTAVDANGVLTYDGGTIDPTGDAGYAQSTGNKRFPSILTRDFLGDRADIDVKVVYTGTGWIAEVSRKLNTGDPWDVVFDPAAELPFGFAIFDNSAIAHGIKPGLNMKFEQ